MERFPNRNRKDCRTFRSFHRGLYTSRSFNSSRHDMSAKRYRRIYSVENTILCSIDECPCKSLRTVNCFTHIGCEPFPFAATYMKCMSTSFALVQRCMLSDFRARNDDSKSRNAFIRRTQQRPLMLECCISAFTFLYEICLIRTLLHTTCYMPLHFSHIILKHPVLTKGDQNMPSLFGIQTNYISIS